MNLCIHPPHRKALRWKCASARRASRAEGAGAETDAQTDGAAHCCGAERKKKLNFPIPY